MLWKFLELFREVSKEAVEVIFSTQFSNCFSYYHQNIFSHNFSCWLDPAKWWCCQNFSLLILLFLGPFHNLRQTISFLCSVFSFNRAFDLFLVLTLFPKVCFRAIKRDSILWYIYNKRSIFYLSANELKVHERALSMFSIEMRVDIPFFSFSSKSCPWICNRTDVELYKSGSKVESVAREIFSRTTHWLPYHLFPYWFREWF